jgi:hypothetical protein
METSDARKRRAESENGEPPTLADAWDDGYRAGYEAHRTEGMFIRFTAENPHKDAATEVTE